MIDPSRTRTLLEDAQRLAEELGRFKTPGTGEPVDPSRLAELSRYLRLTGTTTSLATFLDKLPTSYHAKTSRSALPQLKEIGRVVRPVIARAKSTEELLFVLGWAQRLLQMTERTGWEGQGARGNGQHGRPGAPQGGRQGGGGRPGGSWRR